MAKLKVLVAEDDPTMVNLLKTLLKMEGFQVIAPDADQDVLKAVYDHCPDILLMDVHLSNQNGLEILDSIRKSADGCDPRIIMISGPQCQRRMHEARRRWISAQTVYAGRPDSNAQREYKPAVNSSHVDLREFRFPTDYDAVIRFWESIEKGVHIGPSDAPEEIQKKIQRDPDLFLVAELNNEIVGTVIGGFDGRRGMIYHLAVAASLRGQGIGSRLMSEVEVSFACQGMYQKLFASPAR